MAILLLVDPSRTIRRVVEMAFKASGHDIVAVTSAAEGKQSVARYDPAVVLINYILPDSSGIDLCQTLKSDPTAASVPIVLLGGTFDRFEESQARRAGANAVLMKPFKTEALLSAVKEALIGAPAAERGGAQFETREPSVPAPPPAPPRQAPSQPVAAPEPVSVAQPVARIQPTSPPVPAVHGQAGSAPTRAPSLAPPVPPPPVPTAASRPTSQTAAPPPPPAAAAPAHTAPAIVDNSEAIRAAVREYLPQLVRDALAQLLRDGLENRLRTYAQDRVDAMFRENLRDAARQLVEQELQRLRGG